MPDKDLQGYLGETIDRENESSVSNAESAPLNSNLQPSDNPFNTKTLSFSYTGMNPLIAASICLITLYTTLQNSTDCISLKRLRDYTLTEIKNFDKKTNAYNINPDTALAARYLLCTALDEMVLNTDWGNKSAWSRQSLLSYFHKETFGGERFFIIVDFMSQDPAKNIDLLELAYLLINLGFKGKYYSDTMTLTNIKNNLFELISHHRIGINDRLNSYDPLKISNTNVFITHIPLWVTTAVASVIFLFAVIVSNYNIIEKSFPVYQTLMNIASGK